jgi:hypothetical protein
MGNLSESSSSQAVSGVGTPVGSRGRRRRSSSNSRYPVKSRSLRYLRGYATCRPVILETSCTGRWTACVHASTQLSLA